MTEPRERGGRMERGKRERENLDRGRERKKDESQRERGN
jgi:hypothetical protein